MANKIDMSLGIINEGEVRCIHHEIVAKGDNGHLFGTCSCGRVKDYTLLQDQVLGISGVYAGTKVNKKNTVTFERFVQYQKGQTKALEKRRSINKRMVNL
jgi:hypothetical protein